MCSLNTTGPVVAGDHCCAAEAAHDGRHDRVFTAEALALLWAGPAPGQPGLVNALSAESLLRGQGGPGPVAAHRRAGHPSRGR